MLAIASYISVSKHKKALNELLNMAQKKQRKRGVRRYIIVSVLLLFGWIIWFMWTSFLGNEPMRVWGKVTDIHGASLEGVKVTYRVSKPRFMWDVNTAGRTVTTDLEGEFSIDERGSGLDFEAFEKEGYQ